MEKIINTLWVSQNTPTQKAEKAGGNTFNYYFKSFYNDSRFNVKVIALTNDGLPLMDMNPKDCFSLKREGGFRNKIKKISSIESKYNPFNRNANLISNKMEKFAVQKIRYLLENGFVPDVVILEWTQCVVLANIIKALIPKAKLIASEHDLTFIAYQRKAAFYKGLKKLYWQYKYKHEKKIELQALTLCDLIMTHNPDNSDVLKK
ncbi:MAG: hypothetical protein LIO65_04210 [Odoribacter sp.]|nr:hypothetical protein [Odoribacter sp.]